MAKEVTKEVAKAAVKDDGSKYSYGGIACSVVSFFIFGAILSVIGIILGAVGASKGDKTKGAIAIVIGIISLGLNIMALMALDALMA